MQQAPEKKIHTKKSQICGSYSVQKAKRNPASTKVKLKIVFDLCPAYKGTIPEIFCLVSVTGLVSTLRPLLVLPCLGEGFSILGGFKKKKNNTILAIFNPELAANFDIGICIKGTDMVGLNYLAGDSSAAGILVSEGGLVCS